LSDKLEDSYHNTVGYIHGPVDKRYVAVVLLFGFISIV